MLLQCLCLLSVGPNTWNHMMGFTLLSAEVLLCVILGVDNKENAMLFPFSNRHFLSAHDMRWISLQNTFADTHTHTNSYRCIHASIPWMHAGRYRDANTSYKHRGFSTWTHIGNLHRLKKLLTRLCRDRILGILASISPRIGRYTEANGVDPTRPGQSFVGQACNNILLSNQ